MDVEIGNVTADVGAPRSNDGIARPSEQQAQTPPRDERAELERVREQMKRAQRREDRLHTY
jgi:hypothetical protein